MILPNSLRQDVLSLTAFRLANEIDCGSPDSPESPGAHLLTSVVADVVEAIEYLDNIDPETLADDLDESLHTIADGAPDVGTYRRWLQFADLAAWQEDMSDFGDINPDDITDSVAGVALYIIADRLARWVVDYITESLGQLIDDAIDSASKRGTADGTNAAAWWEQDAIGGRTTGDVSGVARLVLEGLEDGDPEIVDAMPRADLSGQWGDGMTIGSLLADAGLGGIGQASEQARAIGDAYEIAFNDAVEAAIVEACRSILDGAE